MSVEPKVILQKLQNILQQKFRFMRIELCWKTSNDPGGGRIPFLLVCKPTQMPNLRFMTYLPSFYVIVNVEPRIAIDKLTKQIILMQLVTYQGRVIASESIDWEWIRSPQYRLISQLANDSIGNYQKLQCINKLKSHTVFTIMVRKIPAHKDFRSVRKEFRIL